MKRLKNLNTLRPMSWLKLTTAQNDSLIQKHLFEFQLLHTKSQTYLHMQWHQILDLHGETSGDYAYNLLIEEICTFLL